jgi:hypothetical protein
MLAELTSSLDQKATQKIANGVFNRLIFPDLTVIRRALVTNPAHTET